MECVSLNRTSSSWALPGWLQSLVQVADPAARRAFTTSSYTSRLLLLGLLYGMFCGMKVAINVHKHIHNARHFIFFTQMLIFIIASLTNKGGENYN